MKYIITDNSIMVVIDNTTMIIDKSNAMFDEIKRAIEEKKDEIEIIYLFNKEIIDKAKKLLSSTGGRLTDKEKKWKI